STSVGAVAIGGLVAGDRPYRRPWLWVTALAGCLATSGHPYSGPAHRWSLFVHK
ncbi:hypothetical protein GW17_00022917, partial [Ensete ventricosum]